MEASVNRTSGYEFTIIVPFFNEKENLPSLESSMSAYLGKCSVRACMLMVNDGSTDGAGTAAREMCERNPDFFYISLERNTGLSGALKAGFDNCFSPLAGYMDADLQTFPEDFELLLPYTSEYELVTGFRKKRDDSFSKKAASAVANRWRRLFTRDGVRDSCCPLKIIRTETARRLPFFKGMHRFIPALVRIEGGKCREIAVRHRNRVAGKSKYHIFNRLAGPFADCFVLLWMRRRHLDLKISEAVI